MATVETTTTVCVCVTVTVAAPVDDGAVTAWPARLVAPQPAMASASARPDSALASCSVVMLPLFQRPRPTSTSQTPSYLLLCGHGRDGGCAAPPSAPCRRVVPCHRSFRDQSGCRQAATPARILRCPSV